MRRRRAVRGGDARTTAMLASALLHAALLFLLVRHLAQTPAFSEGPIIQVSLVPPPRPAAERPTTPRPPPPRPAPPSTVPPRLAPASPPATASAPPSASAGPTDTTARDAQRTLRGLAGCERPGLNREERERCETRRWAATPPPRRLNLDPSGRYVENPEPFLSRRPTKGCRARATGDTDPMGDSGNARGGVTCVVPF